MNNLQQTYTKQATLLHQYTRDRANVDIAKKILLDNYKIIDEKEGVNINILRQMHNKYANKLNVPMFDSLLGLDIEEIQQRLGA